MENLHLTPTSLHFYLTILCCVLFGSVFFVIAYLIGSIPTGYWTAKLLKGIDIRTVGSSSTGATNVYRSVGKAAGIFVFIVDFLKGLLPTFIFGTGWYAVITAIGTLIGHSRSIFLNFQGGKSAATGLGTLFALNPLVGICTFLTWMLVLYLSKMVSLASILATASCIPYMILFHGPLPYVLYCILGFLYVTYRHKENIKRIMSGTERKIGKANQ